MKKWVGRLALLMLICIFGIAAILIGTIYFHFISQRIYEDSTGHLEEIYDQVNHSFGAFVERNWGLLEGWDKYIALADSNGDNTVSDFIQNEQKYWGFSDFYFIAANEDSMSVEGVKESIDLGEEWSRITEDKEPVMAGSTLSSGKDVTFFVIPTEHKAYKDFGYDAIAVSYTNADMASSLNVNAFSGNAKCFIIHSDGKILLSTMTGGNVYENYLVYLKAASDISAEHIDALRNDWEAGKSGLLYCTIGDVDYSILYQPVGYQDYILLSVVPQSVISAGFLSVQKTTTNVMIVLSMLIGAAVIVLLVMRYRKMSLKSRMELQYRERMFDVLSNSVDDIFIMLDAQKHSVDYLSPNIERLIGIPVEDARKDIRVLLNCVMNSDVVVPSSVLEAIPLQGSISRECEYMHQTTGERRGYRMTVYHMSIQDVRKYIFVMSDRTMELQMNKQLKEALTAARSANEAKSNFLSNMSHDIRTPMNAIVGFSVLLEKDADNPDKVREYTRKITASSHHLLSLINDVLDMSKIESGKTSLNVEAFSIPELLDELNIIIMPQAKAKMQKFKIHVQGVVHEQVIGDKLRLNQILINLLSNAIKYTPDSGEIDFTISELPQAAQQYATLRFAVKDNGIGMSEDFLEQVFSPFSREINSVTNKIQGTGLGMAITKNLVDLMGGIINVESQPEKGSTFTVELTFAIPEKDEGEAWYNSKVSRILVADDDEEICLDIRELMKDSGVTVAYSTEGAKAVDMAVKAHEEGKDYNVILLDLKMPGMDGVQTAQKLRERLGSGVPILVLTSYDWSDIEKEARQAGINAFMPKPFFVSTFWQTIKPLFSEEEARKKIDEEAAEKAMEGRLFLVAEDNEMNSEILTEVMAMEGAKCELAVNGQEAVSKFEASDVGHYDMILMDVQMPVMNGYDATRAIRASAHPEAKTIPIVAMTANTFAEDVRNAMDAGMNGHLAKPIDMKAVREMVIKLLGPSNKSDSNKQGDTK